MRRWYAKHELAWNSNMRHLLVSGPAVATVLALTLFFLGASLWVVAGAFFFGAPAIATLAYLICNYIYPCS